MLTNDSIIKFTRKTHLLYVWFMLFKWFILLLKVLNNILLQELSVINSINKIIGKTLLTHIGNRKK